MTFNRYSYCRNNPLHYTDPSGEFFIEAIAFAIVGGILNAAVNANNIQTNGQAFMYMGIGALASFATAGAGLGVSGLAGTIGFSAASTSGFVGGFVGGFITGAGNAWMQGGSFAQGLFSGFRAG
jgi:fructose-specific phosphotransferase system IIC component